MQDRSGDRKKGMRVVSLTVHRNTLARKRRHDLAKALVASAKDMAQPKDIEGYVIVVFGKDDIYTTIDPGEMDGDAFYAKAIRELRKGESTVGVEGSTG